MHFTITFEKTDFVFSNKRQILESDIVSLRLNSSVFVDYLKQTPYVYVEMKKERIKFTLKHIEVTIEGRVLRYCFEGETQQNLIITDNEP